MAGTALIIGAGMILWRDNTHPQKEEVGN